MLGGADAMEVVKRVEPAEKNVTSEVQLVMLSCFFSFPNWYNVEIHFPLFCGFSSVYMFLLSIFCLDFRAGRAAKARPG